MSQDYIRSLPEHEREAGTFGLRRLHIDPVMFILIVLVAIYGLYFI